MDNRSEPANTLLHTGLPGTKKSSWWSRRTALEKVLFVLLLFVSVAAIVAIIVIAGTHSAGMFSGVKLKEFAIGGPLVIDSNSSHVTPESYRVHQRRDSERTEENPVEVNDSLRPGRSIRVSSASLDNDIDSLTGNGLSHDLRNETQRRRQHQLYEVERKMMETRDRMIKKRMRRSGELERQRRNRRGNPSLGCFRCRSRKNQNHRQSSSFRVGLAVHTVTKISKMKETAQVATSTNDICLTPDCIKIAARMFDSIDQTVDPCDNFFEFACGTWNRLNPIPEDKPSSNTFRKLDDEVQFALRELLQEPIKSTDIDAIQSVKILYQSCMNISSVEEKQDNPLRAMIKEHGGWPVLDTNWSDSGLDLTVTLANLKKFNHNSLFKSFVITDSKNSTTNVIVVDQPRPVMHSRDYYLRGRNDRTLMVYQQMAINVAVTMGANENRTIEQMAEMVDFEIELAKIMAPEESKRDPELQYHGFRLKDLHGNLTDQIDWIKYFETIFTPHNITIDSEEKIVVYGVQYIRDLGELLKKTPKRTVMNYVIWNMVTNRIDLVSQKFVDLQRDFKKATEGTDKDRARWRFCVQTVNFHLGMIVGRMYVEVHFEEKAKASATAMVKRIKASFREMLQEVPWLEDNSKKFAVEKADATIEFIGYPDYIMNDTALNLESKEITLDVGNLFANMLNILKIGVGHNCKNLRQPVENDRWPTAPVVINAYYLTSPSSSIAIPAGIFHPPFYHKNYPMSLNFGGLGMVIGHELTHGFDDKGRQYDINGNLKLWWSNADVDHFKEKTQCMIDQYSNYTIPDVNLNINGRLTQGENIADNGGLKQAYRAYKTWTKSHPVEPSLPGLNFTHDQLFFINFAQVWCGTNRPEVSVQTLRTSLHSPGGIRVIGTVSNSEDFAKAFNCPLGSKMNPVKKCSVW